MLSKQDIIALNQQFHTGRIANPGSLDFALDQAKRSKDWLKGCAFVVRALLSDHVFEDGNKRTAAAVISGYIEMQNLHWNQQKIDHLVITLAKKNIKDLRKITRLIKNVIE